MIQAKEFYDSKKLIEATMYGLNIKLKTSFKSAEEFTEYFLNLQYSLFSTGELKLYDDFMYIFEKYRNILYGNITEEPPSGYFNNAVFFQFRVTAYLYQYFKYDFVAKKDLQQSIQDLEFWTSKVNDKSKFIEYNQKIIKLAQEVLEDKNIYYTIDFKLPFHIQLPNDNYQLNYNDEIIMITTEIFKSEDLISYNKDRYFSKITLQINGFSNCDNYWQGASVTKKDNESSEVLTTILEVMNYFIFHIKHFDNQSNVHIVSPDDIGNITTNQYYENGENHHFALAMQQSGLTMVDISSPTYLTGDINTFKRNIQESALLLYEELYSIALINYQNKDYLGSLIIINSAMEAMVEWYLRSYCYMTENIDFYEDMMLGKSVCNKCSLYTKYKDELGDELPIKPNKQSLFIQIKFVLRDVVKIKNPEIKKIQQFVNGVKQDSVRNDLSHGRKRIVQKEEIDISLNSFKNLEEKLEIIYQDKISE
jgi:hypothetical protein